MGDNLEKYHVITEGGVKINVKNYLNTQHDKFNTQDKTMSMLIAGLKKTDESILYCTKVIDHKITDSTLGYGDEKRERDGYLVTKYKIQNSLNDMTIKKKIFEFIYISLNDKKKPGINYDMLYELLDKSVDEFISGLIKYFKQLKLYQSESNKRSLMEDTNYNLNEQVLFIKKLRNFKTSEKHNAFLIRRFSIEVLKSLPINYIIETEPRVLLTYIYDRVQTMLPTSREISEKERFELFLTQKDIDTLSSVSSLEDENENELKERRS